MKFETVRISVVDTVRTDGVVVAAVAAAGAAIELGRLAARLGCAAPGAEAERRAWVTARGFLDITAGQPDG